MQASESEIKIKEEFLKDYFENEAATLVFCQNEGYFPPGTFRQKKILLLLTIGIQTSVSKITLLTASKSQSS